MMSAREIHKQKRKKKKTKEKPSVLLVNFKAEMLLAYAVLKNK